MEKKQITPEIEGGIKSAMDEPLNLQPTRYGELHLTAQTFPVGSGLFGGYFLSYWVVVNMTHDILEMHKLWIPLLGITPMPHA